MHVLPPRQDPAGTVKATAQESEKGNTTRPPGMPGTEKHVLPPCWTLFEACGGARHSEKPRMNLTHPHYKRRRGEDVETPRHVFYSVC